MSRLTKVAFSLLAVVAEGHGRAQEGFNWPDLQSIVGNVQKAIGISDPASESDAVAFVKLPKNLRKSSDVPADTFQELQGVERRERRLDEDAADARKERREVNGAADERKNRRQVNNAADERKSRRMAKKDTNNGNIDQIDDAMEDGNVTEEDSLTEEIVEAVDATMDSVVTDADANGTVGGDSDGGFAEVDVAEVQQETEHDAMPEEFDNALDGTIDQAIEDIAPLSVNDTVDEYAADVDTSASDEAFIQPQAVGIVENVGEWQVSDLSALDHSLDIGTASEQAVTSQDPAVEDAPLQDDGEEEMTAGSLPNDNAELPLNLKRDSQKEATLRETEKDGEKDETIARNIKAKNGQKDQTITRNIIAKMRIVIDGVIGDQVNARKAFESSQKTRDAPKNHKSSHMGQKKLNEHGPSHGGVGKQ